jgi:PAS domain S-box-containing protein
MNNNKTWSIRRITGFFFLFAVALVVLSYALVMLSGAFLRRDAARVEVSRKAEKTLGQIPFKAGLVIGGDRENKLDLQNLILEYDDQLEILSQGRNLVIFTNEVTIKPVTSTKQVLKLNKLKDEWALYKKNLNVILNEVVEIDTQIVKTSKQVRKLTDSTEQEIPVAIKSVEKIDNPAVQKAYISLVETTRNIQNVHNDLTTLFIAEYTTTQTGIQVLIFFTILVLVVFLILGYIYFGNRFIKPLDKVARITQDIAEGDVSQRVIYDQQDEIGVLASNINLLANNLKKTSEFAKNIGEGKFEYPYQVRSQKDVLGFALLGMRENLLKVAEEDRRRNWANEGFNLFVNILRSNYDNLNELSYNIISNLVKYLKANQGGLFVTVEDSKNNLFLELKAAFAYDRRKYEEARIEIGQGLVGQAVLEKDILHLDKLPEDYIQIASGLGDAPPRHLLIVPLLDNNEAYGAIEIASFKNFEDYEIAFVEKLSENIASTLASVRNSEKTRLLLLESQMVTEQLKAQEEVMRENMESLALVQTEMERSQKELEKMRDNLEQQVKDRTLELREKEAQLSEALKLSNIAPWHLDVRAKQITANDELYDLLRTDKEEQKGYKISSKKFVEEFIAEKDQELVNNKISEAIKSKDPAYEANFEYQMKRANGDLREVVISVKRIEDPATGRTAALYGTIQDITRQKRIEEQIRIQRDALEKQQIEQQKFVAMVENATDFVIMMNPSEEIIYANKVGQQLFGADDYISKRLYFKNFFNEENWNKVQKEVLPNVKNNGYWEGELEMYNLKTHEIAFMSGNIVAIKNAQGEITAVATIMRDVTDKQKILHEMEVSNIRMKAILDSTSDEIVSVDRQYNILSYNEKWADFMVAETGIHPEVGMNLLVDFVYQREGLADILKGHFDRVFEQGAFSFTESFQKFEKKKVKVGGKEQEKDVLVAEYFFQRFYNPVYDIDGNMVGAVSFTQDITEQKMVEREIQRSENRLKAIADSTSEAIVIHEKGYIMEVNTAFTKITGYKAEEVIGQYLFNIFAPETKAVSVINMQLGYDKPYEGSVIHKEGNEIPVEIQGRVVRFEEQRIRIFAIRDVSEQKGINDALQKSKDTLQKIIDALPQSVFWKDKDSVFLGCNRRFLKMVGLQDVQEIIGKTDFDLWENKEDAEYYISADKKVMENGIPELDVLQTRIQANGQLSWIRVSKVPFIDKEGSVIGIIGTYQDVTDQKRSEDNILASKERLRKQIETITLLGSQKLNESGLKEYAAEINVAIATNLEIPRVSVWEFKEGKMTCIDLFEQEEEQHSEGAVLSQSEHSLFFEQLHTEEVIIANPAQISPNTKSLTPNYLSPASITSMLVYPIRVAGKLKGMLVCEHIRTPREWSVEEQSFITSMLDLITLKIEESDRPQVIVENVGYSNIITEQIIEKSKESILAVDENEKIIVFNTKMELIFQNLYGIKIQKGMSWFSLFEQNPNDLARIRKDWYHALETREPFETEQIFGEGEHKSKLRYMIEPIVVEDNSIAGVAFYVRRGSALLTIER